MTRVRQQSVLRRSRITRIRMQSSLSLPATEHLLFAQRREQIDRVFKSSWKGSYHRRRLHWSCLAVRLRLDFGQDCASPFLNDSRIERWQRSIERVTNPILWWWSFHRHLCRTRRRLLWTRLSALRSVDQPRNRSSLLALFKSHYSFRDFGIHVSRC